MARKYDDQNDVRRYLLRQLSGAEEESFEVRLLGDEALSGELEIVEDELIDEYVAEELSKDERVSFEKHFLAAPERKRKLALGKALQRHLARSGRETVRAPQPQPGIFDRLRKWIGRSFYSPIPVAASMLIVALIGFGVWRTAFYESDVDKGLVALNSAYRQERPTQARITSLDYAPFVTTRGSETTRIDESKRQLAELTLLKALDEQPGPAVHHALGKVYLAKGDFDRAIEQFNEALKGDGNNAQIYGDLGATYLEKGKREVEKGKSLNNSIDAGKGLEDLGRSLENLNKAVEINPDLLEAYFNRAMVHQSQGLTQQAEADWRTYLEKDATSPWADEARQNLKVLEEQKALTSRDSGRSIESFMRAFQARDDQAAWEIYRRSHSASGNSVTRTLVQGILKPNAAAQATENIEALSYLGRLELSAAHDAYTSDLSKVYAAATPQTRLVLAQARQDIAKGYELFSQSNIGDAKEFFSRARDAFAKVNDLPESLSAEAAIAQAAAVQPDLELGQEVLTRIVPVCESKQYRWLLAQTLTTRAHIHSNLNNYSEAITNGNRALQLFQELGDVSSTLGNFIQLATLHLFLNDSQTSFSFLARALESAQAEGASPAQFWGIHIATSLNFSALRLYRTALDYQTEALQLAQTTKSPLYISRSYQYSGLTLGSLRRFDKGLESLRSAYELGRPLAKERNGQNIMASASLRLGDLYRVSGDQVRALAAYDESTQLYDGLKFAHYSYAAHKGKFLSYLAQNSDALASQELLVVLNLFEEYREKILEERQKSFFFDREQDIYDLAIDFTYSRIGDQQRAFDYSETCRARNLRELLSHGAEVVSGNSGPDLRTSAVAESEAARSLTAGEIQKQLPEQVQVVQYAVLENRLLIWHVTRSSIFAESVPVESAKLADAVSAAVKQVRLHDENAGKASLKNLFSLLIEPIKTRLDSNKIICFVPDKSLHYVPFGALISGSSGRYLVQDYRMMISPSSTVFIDRTNKAKAAEIGTEERLLAVGDPAFDAAANPKFSNLPGAEREVQAIAAHYPAKRVLVKAQATAKSVINELGQADVAHFAAHYEIDPRSTLSSKLLLAKEKGESAHSRSAELKSSDVYRMNLTRTKLVVLSGCQTGIEQQFGGEGAISFARPFLVAGVPVVVASLWPVDSEATADLMIAFHRFRKQGHLAASDALARAQREMLEGRNAQFHDPYYWAGFATIGGYADF